jgi:hypothetical protein
MTPSADHEAPARQARRLYDIADVFLSGIKHQ